MLIEAYVYERELHTFFKINLFKLQKLKKFTGLSLSPLLIVVGSLSLHEAARSVT